MKLRVCCPESDCNGFQSGLRFLTSYGIEPEILSDEVTIFNFEFQKAGKRNESLSLSESSGNARPWYELLVRDAEVTRNYGAATAFAATNAIFALDAWSLEAARCVRSVSCVAVLPEQVASCRCMVTVNEPCICDDAYPLSRWWSLFP